jgi:hypothetical protein
MRKELRREGKNECQRDIKYRERISYIHIDKACVDLYEKEKTYW